MTLFAAVEERLKTLGTTAYAVEQQHNLPEDAVRSILRGGKKSGTTLNRAKAVCDALGLELYIGPRRDRGQVEHTIINGEDFAAVPRLDARLSAGGGADNGHAEVIENLAFRRDWLQRLGIAASAAVLVSVHGDSMEPTLHDGDLALIDTAQKQVRSGHVYAVTDQGQTRVKRVDVLPGEGLLLRSDNPSYQVEPRLGSDANMVQVIGQVMWSGHVWR